MPGPTVTMDDGTSSDCTDAIRRQVERRRRAGRRGPRRPARRPRSCPPPNGTTTTPSSLHSGEQGRGLLGGAGQDDGVRGVGGVALAAAQQVQVALAAGAPQPGLPVGADVLLAEQLDQRAARASSGSREGASRISSTATGGVGRGVQPSSLARCRRAALGSVAAEVGRAVARGVGGRSGPSPGSSVPAARARLQSAGAPAGCDHGDRPLPGSLSPQRRARTSAGVAGAPVDVVVVGGGVTGAGVALDAASRGLSVVLLERADLAAGTSRWSSKLVHGGLRYLAHGEIGLARESARERAVLMGTTAPHLVRQLPFLVPDVAGRDVTALGRRGRAAGRRSCGCSVAGGRGSLPVDPAGGRRRGRAGWCPACGPGGAASSSGTGSSATTPGWSWRWPARRRRTGRGC